MTKPRQSNLISYTQRSRGNSLGVDVRYDASATELFARFTTPPTTKRKVLINDLIVALKDAGVWTKLDAFYVLAAADSQAARRNWISDQYNLTAVAAPAFVADRGYTGDGSTSYLDSSFTPSTAAGKFTRNSAHMAIWSRTDVANDGYFDIGVVSGAVSVLNARRTDNNYRVALNESGLTTLGGGAIASSVGHAGVERTGASAKRVLKDGVERGADTTASTANPNGSITLLRGGVGGGFSQRQLAGGHFGESGIDWSATYTALNTYLTAIGAT